MLCGAGLGANRGAGAMALYGVMGTAGLPFFSEGESGIDVIWGATGGYIVGFVLAAYVVGRLAERRMDRDPWKALPLFTVGQLIIFAIGVPWLAVVVDATPAEAISMGFTPFILGGIVKAVAAAALLPTAWKLAGRR
jgi:biotin transport system substrate-specific component